MADPNEPRAATLPNPPAYLWHEFTPAKLERMDELRGAYAEQTGQNATAATRIPDIPEDLVHLQPPEEPDDGRWRIFSELYTLQDALPSLREQNIQQLGPDFGHEAPGRDDKRIDEALELKKLAKSLLLNFLELVGILAMNPRDATEKLEDLKTLLINMHHNINQWRPHQTREALIALMQTQLERTQNETKALREATENARRVLEGLASIEVPDEAALFEPENDQDGSYDTWTDDQKKEAQRARDGEIWAAMDAVFD